MRGAAFVLLMKYNLGFSAGKNEGKRQHGRPGNRRKYKVKTYDKGTENSEDFEFKWVRMI
jgi:hypothetical protein